ncbi:MAG: ATPase, T2SS/T4P/T4SS family, partial [Phycisphaerae bacterium]
RDTETARLAVQAAMTGHLVFSTLHANDAASTLARLKDLDVPPFLIVSTVLASISQRLVRRTCPDCREPYEPPKEWLAGTPLEGVSLTHGAGCDLCMNTGYHGRLAVFEILHLTEPLRAAFLEGCSGDALRTMAYEAGTCSMHDAAIEAVANGETTIEEVRRILPPEEFKQ